MDHSKIPSDRIVQTPQFLYMPYHHTLAEKNGTDCFVPWLTGCPTSFHELAQIFEYSSDIATICQNKKRVLTYGGFFFCFQ